MRRSDEMSTQEITKFLRTQDTIQIVPVIDDILHGTVKFPNDRVFLFELICNKLHKFKSVQDQDPEKFDIYNHLLWKYLGILWDEVSLESRGKYFRKVKFLDILCLVLKGNEMIKELNHIIKLVLQDDLIKFDEPNFKKYVSLLKVFPRARYSYDNSSSEDIIVDWSQILLQLMRSFDFSDINDSLSELLPMLVKEENKYIHTNIETIVKKKINTDKIGDIIDSQILSEDSVIELYRILLSVDEESKERLFLRIVKQPKYKNISIGLLKLIKGSLSMEFLDSIFEEGNWEMTSCLFEMNDNLTIYKTPKIINTIDDSSKHLIPIIVSSYIRSRQFSKFIELWEQQKDALWSNEYVVDSVASQVHKLPLLEVIEALKSTKYEVILSIVKGMRVSLESIKSAVLQLQLTWELKFYLLSTYPELLDDLKGKDQADVKDPFFFYYQFRVLELTGTNENITTTVKTFKPKDPVYFLKRWFKIIDKYDIDIRVSDTKLIEVFKNDEIFEHPKLMERLIANIADLELIPLIPIQCFTKKLKEKYVALSIDKNIKTLEYLLPSFSSVLETKPEKLIEFTTKDNSTVFKKIWINSQKEFRSEIINLLKDNLHNSLIIDIVLRTKTSKAKDTEDSDLDDLKEKYFKFIEKQLNKTKNEDEIIGYLKSYQKTLPLKIIKKLGKRNSMEINKLLFKSFTQYSNVYRVLSLYMILDIEEEEIIEYLRTQPNAVSFVVISFEYDLESFKTSIDDKAITKYISLFKCLLQIHEEPWLLTHFISKILSNIETFTKHIIDILQIIERAENFNQYNIELIFNLIYKLDFQTSDEERFNLACKIMSNILLFKRFRLSSRNHLIVSNVSKLTKALTMDKPLGESSICAFNLNKLINNLCNPPIKVNNLTNKSVKIKKQVSFHMTIYIINYIQMNLSSNFNKVITNELTNAIYEILNICSKNDLKLINNYLDTQGKFFFKSLYKDFLAYGKWNE